MVKFVWANKKCQCVGISCTWLHAFHLLPWACAGGTEVDLDLGYHNSESASNYTGLQIHILLCKHSTCYVSIRISLGLFPVRISNVGICLRFLVCSLFHPSSIWICGHFQMWSRKNLCCVTLLRQWARATRTYDTQFRIFFFALRKSETACSKSLWLVLIVIKVSHNTHI